MMEERGFNHEHLKGQRVRWRTFYFSSFLNGHPPTPLPPTSALISVFVLSIPSLSTPHPQPLLSLIPRSLLTPLFYLITTSSLWAGSFYFHSPWPCLAPCLHAFLPAFFFFSSQNIFQLLPPLLYAPIGLSPPSYSWYFYGFSLRFNVLAILSPFHSCQLSEL